MERVGFIQSIYWGGGGHTVHEMERMGFTQSIFLGCWWSYIGVILGHTGHSPCNGGWGSYSSFNGGGGGNTVLSLGSVI